SPLPLPVLFYRCRGPCARHPFPTRRSSDLVATASARIGDGQDLFSRGIISRANALAAACGVMPGMACKDAAELLKTAPWPHAERSEEHTSELQSRGHLVCRLLLEKKKHKIINRYGQREDAGDIGNKKYLWS